MTPSVYVLPSEFQSSSRAQAGLKKLPPEYTAAAEVVQENWSQAAREYPWPVDGDIAVSDFLFNLHKRPPQNQIMHINYLLVGLKYRYRFQENVLGVMEELVSRGLVSMAALDAPISTGRPEPGNSIDNVVAALKCFDDIAKVFDYQPLFEPGKEFYAPIYWLATVIVRSCGDFRRILDYLCTSWPLGKPREDEMQQITKMGQLVVNVDPEAGLGKSIKESIEQWAFWLPSGISMEDFVKSWRPRYLKATRAYDGVMNEKWGETEVAYEAILRLMQREGAMTRQSSMDLD